MFKLPRLQHRLRQALSHLVEQDGKLQISHLHMVPRLIQQLLQRGLRGFSPANPLAREEQRDQSLWGATSRAKPCSKGRDITSMNSRNSY